MLFHVAAEGGINGISPALQGNFSIVWLHVTHFFFEVVKAKRQAVAGVQKPSLLQGTMLCDQDLNERSEMRNVGSAFATLNFYVRSL